ncbi:MAG: putative toxin-antitoxin system toxin component, PIN family [Bacteroidetes bacterium GWA2_31_9]|nr:MAG: putative toxin-antitoxin system toxin component, PIN family [Bacteroidetes bacterium GWA2_31_9]
MIANKIKIVIDTNIWISYIIGKAIAPRFNKLLLDNRFVILSDNELYEELKSVIYRPKFKKYISSSHAEYFMQLFIASTSKINVCSVVEICEDVDDNFILALAKDSNANFLITGDKPHLLKLNTFENTQIITFSEFYKMFF